MSGYLCHFWNHNFFSGVLYILFFFLEKSTWIGYSEFSCLQTKLLEQISFATFQHNNNLHKYTSAKDVNSEKSCTVIKKRKKPKYAERSVLCLIHVIFYHLNEKKGDISYHIFFITFSLHRFFLLCSSVFTYYYDNATWQRVINKNFSKNREKKKKE